MRGARYFTVVSSFRRALVDVVRVLLLWWWNVLAMVRRCTMNGDGLANCSTAASRRGERPSTRATTTGSREGLDPTQRVLH